MNDTIVKVAMLMYNLTLLGGTAYLVQACNWSIGTFIFAALFFLTSSKTEKNGVH